MRAERILRGGWSRLRGSPWWAQVAVGLVALTLAASAVRGPEGPDAQLAVEAPSSTTATTERATTTSEPPPTTGAPTTTTLAEAPEGGTRAGGADLTAGAELHDAVARDAVTPADLAALEALVVAVEHGGGYERSLFPHWDDVDGNGCDTRCEVLSSQQLAGGGWFSEWDGATEHDPSLVHVDHVVALAEAWRSGAHAWTPAQRDEFADDRANLLAVTATANLRKGDDDAAEWFPSRYEANCLWARTVVAVKGSWSLTVDRAERDALANLLRSCGAAPAPTTTTAAPPPPPPVATQPADAGDGCTPGYSPCLPPAEDYDCSSGSGNGPAYTGRVSVDHAHGDPYDLDRDGDGVGCD